MALSHDNENINLALSNISDRNIFNKETKVDEKKNWEQAMNLEDKKCF